MNCEHIRNRILDYHYGELDEQQSEEVRSHLNNCSECSREYAALRDTSRLIGKIPDAELKKPIKIPVQTRQASVPVQRMRWPYYAAAAVLAIMVLASLANLHIRYDDSGFELSMSLLPASEQQTENHLTEADLIRLQQEQTDLMLELIRVSREQQQAQFDEAINEVLISMEENRIRDLELFVRELDRIEDRTDLHLTQTDQLLYELIQTVSY